MPKPKLEHWETIKRGLDKYDKGMCDAWNDELTTILTFVRGSTFFLTFPHTEECVRLVCFLQR